MAKKKLTGVGKALKDAMTKTIGVHYLYNVLTEAERTTLIETLLRDGVAPDPIIRCTTWKIVSRTLPHDACDFVAQLIDFWCAKGWWPTVRELADWFDEVQGITSNVRRKASRNGTLAVRWGLVTIGAKRPGQIAAGRVYMPTILGREWHYDRATVQPIIREFQGIEIERCGHAVTSKQYKASVVLK